MRRGLFSLLIPVCLCSPAYGQVDSGNQTMQTVHTPPDSNMPMASDTHRVVAAPAIVTDSVSKPEEIIAEPVAAVQRTYPVYWLAGAGLLGLMLGAFSYKLLFRKRADATIDPSLSSETQAADDAENQRRLELENDELHAQNTRLMADNEQLRRDNAELEQLVHTQSNGSGASNMAEEIIFYMPQPNMNGRFQEASRRTDAANALYAFRVQADHPGIASFEFIAKDAYLNAAIGNEPSWIAIACDRTNQPSASTTKVKTDVPGMAHLQNGEWEITRKARITYL